MSEISYYGANVTISYQIDGSWQKYSLSTIADFLRHVLKYHNLPIAAYLPSIGQEPFFLVAATGLGKTVAIPTHIFLRQCEQVFEHANDYAVTSTFPHIYVVEPRIPIAVEEMEHMNQLFSDFIREYDPRNAPANPVLFGSVTSATGQINPNAPIKFVTTGIFELLAESGDLISGRDRIIIDEAHVTVEQNGEVELAIAICRHLDVVVDYMSATVDTRNIRSVLGVNNIIKADKHRFPIWLHNLKLPLEDVVVDLVKNTLVNPDRRSSYFPSSSYPNAPEVINGVLNTGNRASGMLIVVNSFQSESSDINRIAKMIERASYNQPHQQVVVLKLASAIIRDRAKKAAFDQQMATIERKHKKYVIVATSVVEMGITYPTLDYVVTMDSGYQNETIGDVTLPRLVPLGANALRQRVGRVGRNRAGIGYITREVGADYTELSDEELNSNGLQCESIKLPLAKASLTKLALYSFTKEWTDPLSGFRTLQLPSKIETDPSRVSDFQRERRRFLDLGIASGQSLSALGKYCKDWVGMSDLGYAVRLQEALEQSKSKEIVYFYLVAVALSQISLSDLLPAYGHFLNHHPDADKKTAYLMSEKSFIRPEEKTGFWAGLSVSYESSLRQSLAKSGYTISEQAQTSGEILIRATKRALEVSATSEVLTLYRIVRYFSNAYAKGLFGNVSEYEYAAQMNILIEEAYSMGFDGYKVRNALNSVNSTLKYFQRINQARVQLEHLLGSNRRVLLSQIELPEISRHSAYLLIAQVNGLPERERIIVHPSEYDGQWDWQTVSKDKRGDFSQEKTTISLKDGLVLTAKIVPEMGHVEWEDANTWKPTHMQVA